MAVEFSLLGEVQARVDGSPVELGHARQRCVLVALLVDANRSVPAYRLLDRVWGAQHPQRARNALSGYVSRLRRLLGPHGDVAITRQSDGYILTVDPDAVDLHRFHRLLTEARSATCGGGNDTEHPSGADPAGLLRQALSLWRGDPFGTLDTPWLAGIRAALAAERLAAELDLVDLALVGGRHAELLGELAVRAAEHPFDERIAGQLMKALYQCGRQADALLHYQEFRSRLVEEVGMDPAAALQRVYHQILTGDPALEASTVSRDLPRASGTGVSAAVPHQLPTSPSAFTGRERELAELDALVDPAPGTSGTAAVSGSAGVGKSALAVYWAHRTADRFPDGQLYVDLRGFDPDGTVVSPAEAVRGFLDAFGVPAQRVPIGLAAQIALYRSLVAGRRVLVVLDNARDGAQVRHLLPGAGTCATVVTSRNELSGLIAIDGARAVTLDLFTGSEARRFLARRLGPDRVANEPAAVDEIVARCARLPLALAVVAARAATHRGFSLADVVAELRAAGSSLDPFDGGEPAADVRAVFSWSYRALTPAAARMFRLIGQHPEPELSAPAAASLSFLSMTAARRLLTELARAHLISERSPGRYVMHDLLQAYAAERAEAEELAADRRAAAKRLLDHYLHTAYAADRVLYPHRDPIVLTEPVPGAGPEPFDDRAEAMAWLRTERQTLHTLVDWASRTGFDRHTWQLAWSLTSFFNLRGYWHDQARVQSTALAAARRIGDDPAQAHVHRNLGRAHTQLGELDQARLHLAQALDLFIAVGDRANQAQTNVNIARVLEQQGRDIEALHHDQRSLDLYRDVGHLPGQARALNNIAWMLARLGDHDEARALCRQALRLNEDIGNRHGAATNWQSLGYIDRAAGAYREAIAGCQRALDLFHEVGDRCGAAETLVCLGEARLGCGELRAAVEAWKRALPLLDEMGHVDADRVRRQLLGQPEPAAHERASRT
jgi:DNA-binding SARP family transcriptional activator/tetratricopeptide (TPR) repeat protein